MDERDMKLQEAEEEQEEAKARAWRSAGAASGGEVEKGVAKFDFAWAILGEIEWFHHKIWFPIMPLFFLLIKYERFVAFIFSLWIDILYGWDVFSSYTLKIS